MLLSEVRGQLTSISNWTAEKPFGLAGVYRMHEVSSNKLFSSLQKKLKTQPAFPSSGLANGWITRINTV